MADSKTFWQMMLEAPESQINPVLIAEMASYGDDPTLLQIATALQKCVRYGMSSDFVVNVFNIELKARMETPEAFWTLMKESANLLLAAEEARRA